MQFTQEVFHAQQFQRFQRQALVSDGSCIEMFDLVRENGVARIRGSCMDVKALVQEPFDDVIHRVPEVFIKVRQQDAGLSSPARGNLVGEFGPVLLRDTESLCEVEQDSLCGFSTDASGMKEGECGSYLAVSEAVLRGLYEDDAARASGPGLCYGCSGGEVPYHCPFPYNAN